ncbi:hypothetical protein F8R89_30705 [Streptomyces sp. SS1-1]|uniref:hypothetical protein n=1 Tax=Streptomyces sp. SS1-1 TaxID=2651869 RepID=UPI00125053BB|nr:hypothetical protein [Streptomyces sp. SS1-1]KAB2975982.1 hypothetical protein F8R89_30705 [Streptomyces sp. SS1-1]
MERTGRTRVAAIASAVTLILVGFALLLHGIAFENLPRAVGGLGINLVGDTAIVLFMIRAWITDTNAQRRELTAAQHVALAQRDHYFAAQAAVECERSRVTRDAAAERAANAARLRAERDSLAAEFEERRAELIAETMEATFLMMRSGKLTADEQSAGKLIPFPAQLLPHRQAEQARSREHGVVGP